jgi:hypothetical protein
MRNLPPLPDEVWADPGRHGWYFREKKTDSVAKYIREDLHPDGRALVKLASEVNRLTDRITALEAQIAAADGLADEADAAAGTLDCLGMRRQILELKIAAFRAAKGE